MQKLRQWKDSKVSQVKAWGEKFKEVGIIEAFKWLPSVCSEAEIKEFGYYLTLYTIYK
ncbi:hypothetical protein LFU01_45670 [Lysinibacillus fusiformis]|nr:hypothetical protein LFU01_45670 [Lysinibacillus fusiformis]